MFIWKTNKHKITLHQIKEPIKLRAMKKISTLFCQKSIIIEYKPVSENMILEGNQYKIALLFILQ